MKQKEIQKRLRQYAAKTADCLPDKRRERMEALLKREEPVRTRGNLWDFICEQVGYLLRHCLFWQIIWFVLFCCLMKLGPDILVMISVLPPLLVLLTVEEITKVYQRSMMEIEYATRYSLQNVVVVRMLVLCAVHFLILFLGIAGLHASLDSGMGCLLIYGFTPMVLSASVLTGLMRYLQGQRLRIAGMAVYVMLVLAVIAGKSSKNGMYEPDYIGIWCVVCAVGILFGICQFIRLNRQLARFEQLPG